MTEQTAYTSDEMIDDLAKKDAFFATTVKDEKSSIAFAFETAAWESCPHIVTILDRQGLDTAFNQQAQKTARACLPSNTQCLSGIIFKRDLDWSDTRTRYGFSDAAAAAIFARAVQDLFGTKTATHTIKDAGPDPRVFIPHSDGPELQ